MMDPKKKAAKLAALEDVKHGLGEYIDEDAIGALGAKRKPDAEGAKLKDQEDEFWEQARGEDPEKAKVAIGFLATKYSDLKDFADDEDAVVEMIKGADKRPLVIANEDADGGVTDLKALKTRPKEVDTSKLSQEAREMLKKIKDLTTVPEGEGFLEGAKKGLDKTKERQMKLQEKMRESMKGMEDLVKKDPDLLTPEELKKIQEFIQKAKGNSPDAGE
jgi:hypothetical protein